MKKLIIVLALFFTFEAKAQYTIELASDSISNSQFRIAGAYTVPQDWVIDSVHIVMNAKSPTNITRLVLKRGIKLGSDKFVYITQVGDSLTATGMVITANDSTATNKIGKFVNSSLVPGNYYELYIQSNSSGNTATLNRYKIFAVIYARRL